MKTFKETINGIQKDKEEILERDQLEEGRSEMTREELEARKRKSYGYDEKPITSEEKHSGDADLVPSQVSMAKFKSKLKFKQ